jgi:hypothetical protein
LSYAITKINGWTNLKISNIKQADFATLDGKYCVNVQLCMEKFTEVHNVRVKQKYRVLWFDGYQVKQRTYCNVIWVKDGKKGLACYNVMPEMFTKTVQDSVAKGFMPVHVDSYMHSSKVMDKRAKLICNGDPRFAIIFVESSDSDYILQPDLPFDDLSDRTKTLKDLGYSIKCQSPYVVDDQCHVAVLFVRVIADRCWPKPRLAVNKYQGEFDKQSRYGHLPSYLKCYTVDDTVNFSAIWSDPGAYLYTAEHDMSKYRVLTDLLLVSQTRFYPLCIAGYEDEGDHKYAIVCVKQTQSKK